MVFEMYKENIIDHYKHPRNFGKLDDAQSQAHSANPLCGDELDFFLKFDDTGRIADVKFSGSGCTISIAVASMLSEEVQGMTKVDVEKLSNDDSLKMLGVTVNPARLKCATLALETVQKAIGHH